jgi:hypothetical protein
VYLGIKNPFVQIISWSIILHLISFKTRLECNLRELGLGWLLRGMQARMADAVGLDFSRFPRLDGDLHGVLSRPKRL